VNTTRAAYWDGGSVSNCSERWTKISASEFDIRNVTYTDTIDEANYNGNAAWPVADSGVTLMFRDCRGCDVDNVTLNVRASHTALGIERDALDQTYSNMVIKGIPVPGCLDKDACAHSQRLAAIEAQGDANMTNVSFRNIDVTQGASADILRPGLGIRLEYGTSSGTTFENVCSESGWKIVSGHAGAFVGTANQYQTGSSYSNTGSFTGTAPSPTAYCVND
jgi:hypothetical protein